MNLPRLPRDPGGERVPHAPTIHARQLMEAKMRVLTLSLALTAAVLATAARGEPTEAQKPDPQKLCAASGGVSLDAKLAA